MAVILSGVIDIARNLRDHGLSLSRGDAALAPRVVGLAEASSLSEVEAAGEEELGARAVAVVENGAGSVHGEVKGAAVAELRDSAVALDQAGLAGDLGVNERLRNAARAVGSIATKASIRDELEGSTDTVVNSVATADELHSPGNWVSGVGARAALSLGGIAAGKGGH